MIVVMRPECSKSDILHVTDLLRRSGLDNCVIRGSQRDVIEILGPSEWVDRKALETAPMVERVLDKDEPLLAGARLPGQETREIPLGNGAVIGGGKVAAIAGPCSVESEDQLFRTAEAVREAGAVALRGGAFKPRSSPHSFQGLGERGLEMLARAREKTGLAVVTEVMCCEQVELVSKYADVLQVGSRNMHNTHLLLSVGRQSKPVLLKRGWSSSLNEFLLAADYIMQGGNGNVILCERGIRTFESYVRNTLALAVVPEIKRRSTLPIIVDPSHGTGQRHLVTPMSNAAVACGADGLIIEVHPSPTRAWSDGYQTLDAEQFHNLMEGLVPFARATGREVTRLGRSGVVEPVTTVV
jgi:3-deoxy-7-phosphoheptulonate synthase